MSKYDVETAQPGGLLADLFRHGVIGQGEVAVTRSIVYCLSLPGASHSLDGLMAKAGLYLAPDQEVSWHAEVVAASGVRPDIEGWWGDPPCARVVIEAKLGHDLTEDQVAAYVTNLKEDDNLVVVLVPEHRRREADGVLRGVMASPAWPGQHLRGVVWSYDEVLRALSESTSHPDLGQLQALVDACEALDIKPITEQELLTSDNGRVEDIVRVLHQATLAFFTDRRVLPSGPDSDFAWRRYIEAVADGTSIAVGVRLSTAVVPRPWAWIRVHAGTPGANLAFEALRALWPDNVSRDRDDHTWMPIDVPLAASGSTMVEAVTAQIENVLRVLREATESPRSPTG